MKKIVYLGLFMGMVLNCISAYAGSKEDPKLCVLAQKGKLCFIEFDYSNLMVEGYKLSDYLRTQTDSKDHEAEWNEQILEMEVKFRETFSDENKEGAKLVLNGDYDYKILVHMNNIELGSTGKNIAKAIIGFGGSKKGGSKFNGTIDIIEKSTNEIITTYPFDFTAKTGSGGIKTMVRGFSEYSRLRAGYVQLAEMLVKSAQKAYKSK